MATLLYIFPHPDDESFGPGPGIARQRREGHDVHLLTLTRGEATSYRERFGYSKPEMARMRYRQMQQVTATLNLSSLTVLEYPDGRLSEVNPLVLEDEIVERIRTVAPDVLVTFPHHGISGHPDHIVTHCTVKRVFCALTAESGSSPNRLAFFTLPPSPKEQTYPDDLQPSPADRIDCVYSVLESDLAQGRKALDHYITYHPDLHRPLRFLGDEIPYEVFGETHDPPLSSLLESLTDERDDDGGPNETARASSETEKAPDPEHIRDWGA